MNYDLILLLSGIMLFAYWFTYICGSPLADNPNDIDAKAILFSFPFTLAKRRLIQFNLFKRWHQELVTELSHVSDQSERILLRIDKKKEAFIKGREFFTWERSLFCPICLHWWLTVIVGAFLLVFDLMGARQDFFIACFTYLALHFIIRKIA